MIAVSVSCDVLNCAARVTTVDWAKDGYLSFYQDDDRTVVGIDGAVYLPGDWKRVGGKTFCEEHGDGSAA